MFLQVASYSLRRQKNASQTSFSKLFTQEIPELFLEETNRAHWVV